MRRTNSFFITIFLTALLCLECVTGAFGATVVSDNNSTSCPDCKNGTVSCSYCGGKGKTAVGNPCFLCNQTGKMSCKTCNGTGKISVKNETSSAKQEQKSGTVCSDCKEGKVKCSYCGGKGSTYAGNPCYLCNQSGYVNCASCNGTGKIQPKTTDTTPQKEGEACKNCKNGKVSCNYCGGAGKTAAGNKCYVCDGAGTFDCSICNGTGIVSPKSEHSTKEAPKTEGNKVLCPNCYGIGTSGDCMNCHGTGIVERSTYMGGSSDTMIYVCPLCIAGKKRCTRCNGSGVIYQ